MHQEAIGTLPILPSEPRVVATVVFRPLTGPEMWAESFRQTLSLVPHDKTIGGIMKQRFSSYPIGELLIETLRASGLKLPDFMREIGYSPHNGIATFDQWISKGHGNPLFIERLTSSRFAPPVQELRQALADTEQIRGREKAAETRSRVEAERSAFRPFVQGIAELSRPTSITMFALTGGPRRYTVELPEGFAALPGPERERIAGETIRENFAANSGRTLFMGKLVGYLLFHEYGERPQHYSVEGRLLGAIDARPAQTAVLTVNGRPLPHGLLAIQSMRP